MSLVSNELDYKSVDVSHGSYQMSKVTPQIPLNSISNAGQEESIFEIPSKVINFGKSILSFKATPSVVTTFKWFHADGIPFFRQLQLYTREGLFLCDIQNCNYYMKCVNRKSNKISDVQSYDKASAGDGYFGGIFCGNSAAAQDTTGQRPDRSPAKTAFLEPAYCIGGGAGGDATPILNVQIPLSRVVDSILGMDKDQYFGESVYLRVVWSPATDILWKSSSATDPTGTAVEAFDGTITMENLTLYTAVEQNPVIVNALKDKYKSGTLTYNCPFVHMNTVSGLAVTGTNNLSVRYSRPHGSRLKKIIWSPFNGAAGINNLRYDNSNLGKAKVSDYYTMVNNVRTTQFNYEQVLGNEWLAQKDRLIGSCILSSNEFYYNFTHVEDFTGSMSTTHNANLDEGLLLDEEIKYDIQATAASALRHYIFGITTKTLTLSPSGVTFI